MHQNAFNAPNSILIFKRFPGIIPKSKSKSIYLNKSLDTQVQKDTDASPTTENKRTMRHTGLCELHTHTGGKVDKF